MQFKIKTHELKDMVSKNIHCVSNNKLIPLTSLMNIKVEDGFLTLTTTDATNYFYVSKKDKVDCENFEISVMADLFTKLIQKTTSDEIELSLDNGNLQIKGNGTYVMELPLDENGSVIKFPKKLNDEFRDNAGTIKLTTVKNIINYNKPSLAISMELPSLANYYCGDSVVTSDSYKICSTKIKLLENPIMITSSLMELLGVLTEEDIQVTLSNNDIIFETSTDRIYAPIPEGIETFPISAIEGLIDSEFNSFCKVSRLAMLNVIDRLSLFVSPYDKKGIYMTFTNDGVMLSSKKSSGKELIPYISSDNFKPYTCCIDIDMLRSQIATQELDTIELHYGSEIAIKLVEKNITQIVSLMEDDRAGE